MLDEWIKFSYLYYYSLLHDFTYIKKEGRHEFFSILLGTQDLGL